MQIEVITTYYREEFLIPLFMLHYNWADKITIITRQEPDGRLDDIARTEWINEAIRASTADWVVLVDPDEFIFPNPPGTNPRQFLAQAKDDIYFSAMVRVWRHISEGDIDRNSPPLPQRRHGQPDHVKPCVFHPKGVDMKIGNHTASFPDTFKRGSDWGGAHWANADVCFWIDRETRDRGPRMSQRNIANGFGFHAHRTEQKIREECQQHGDDPIVL